MLRSCLALAVTLAAATGAGAQPDAARGALLYENHCSACHTTQMHWRDARVATDWASLRALVRRWQAAAHLNWGDDEVDEVARYLNQRFYHFEPPRQRLSRAAG